jgi:hypothetical protein
MVTKDASLLSYSLVSLNPSVRGTPPDCNSYFNLKQILDVLQTQ